MLLLSGEFIFLMGDKNYLSNGTKQYAKAHQKNFMVWLEINNSIYKLFHISTALAIVERFACTRDTLLQIVLPADALHGG